MCRRSLVLLILLFAIANHSPAQRFFDVRRMWAAQNATAIAALRAEWIKNLHLKRLDRFMMLYAPNASFLTASGKRITGQLAIRELTKKAMDSFTSDIELRSVSTGFSGELAYDSGDYRETLTATSDGSKTLIQGNYLTIYQRSANHKWLIVQHVWTELSTPSHNASNADLPNMRSGTRVFYSYRSATNGSTFVARRAGR